MRLFSQQFRVDHQILDTLLDAIVSRVHEGDTDPLGEAWARFRSALTAHMDVEEHHLLTRFEEVAPAEAARVLKEHDQIRLALREIQGAIERHALRHETIEEFSESLRAHAMMEEKVLYPWAEASPPPRG